MLKWSNLGCYSLKAKNEVENPGLTLKNSDCYVYLSLWENMIEKKLFKTHNLKMYIFRNNLSFA